MGVVFNPVPARLMGVARSAMSRVPTTIRGRHYWWPAGAVSNQRYTSDSIGSTTLNLTNVVVGSRYRIEVASTGALAEPAANAEGTAGASTVPITLDLYTAGSVNNDLRIKVRKGSAAPKYQPFETVVVLTAAAQSVYVAQVADPIA